MAVYIDDATVDRVQARVDLIGVVTSHLGTDQVDLVILNQAPTALLGRILQSRQVIVDKDPFLRRLRGPHARSLRITAARSIRSWTRNRDRPAWFLQRQ